MAEEDLNNWLKVSSQNKINRKNAWKSTLINHFSDISNFKEEQGINFEKATFTLDGCTKTYSVRVDDVHEDAFKLLGSINKDDKIKKPKKKSNFLEKNLTNINIKDKPSSDFYDPVFMSVFLSNKFELLTYELEPTSEGLFMYNNSTNNLFMNDEKVNIEYKGGLVCPSLKEIKNLDDLIFEEPVPISINNEVEFEANNNFEADMEAGDEVDMDNLNVEEEKYVFSSTPFGYFKGWAGPSHWKTDLVTHRRVKPSEPKRPKEVFKIDFSPEHDLYECLKKQADTTMSHEAILSRRQNKNLLPEDHRIQSDDLYKFIIADGYFKVVSSPVNSVIDDQKIEDVGFDVEFNDCDDLSNKLDNSLILEDSNVDPFKPKLIGKAKKVDMKKLKQSILTAINGDNMSLSSIVDNIPASYTQREAKDITPHFCLISLLHLANETSIELELKNDDVFVKK